MSSHVYLVGFMGSGKSTVGRLLAERTGRPFVDLDDRIEASQGRSIADIFEEDGEGAFRGMESRVLESLARQADSVVACGGGVVIDPNNRVILRDTGRTVHLRVSAEKAVDRVGDTDTRPLLAGGTAAAEELLASRRGAYEAVAELTVDTDEMGLEQVVEEILAWLEAS